MRRQSMYRRMVASAGVLALAGMGLGAAMAPSGAAIEVGGGAAAVMVQATMVSPTIFGPLGPLVHEPYLIGEQLNIAYPEVILPPGGHSEIDQQGVGQTIGPVTVGVAHVTTQGTPAGTPYAESSATIASVSIPGTAITAIRTHCVWDTSGAVGSTEIVTAGGAVYWPAPNTTQAVPGLGTLIFNKQVTEFGTIAVTGIELNLYAAVPIDGYTASTISIAFSSCDPNGLPILSGLTSLVQGL